MVFGWSLKTCFSCMQSHFAHRSHLNTAAMAEAPPKRWATSAHCGGGEPTCCRRARGRPSRQGRGPSAHAASSAIQSHPAIQAAVEMEEGYTMALAHGEAVPHTSEIRPAQRWICARYRPRANNPSMCRTNLGSMWDRLSMGRLLDPKPLHAHTCICRDLSRSLNIFQNLSTSPEISQNLSKSLRISQNLSKSFKISQNLSRS